MRVCINRFTGKLIESQSGGEVDRLLRGHQVFIDVENKAREVAVKENLSQEEIETAAKFAGDAAFSVYETECAAVEHNRLATLSENALNVGYNSEDIDTKWVTDEEYIAITEANKPAPTYAELRRAAYPKIDSLIVALWEYSVENRPESMALLQEEREKTKLKYPKT